MALLVTLTLAVYKSEFPTIKILSQYAGAGVGVVWSGQGWARLAEMDNIGDSLDALNSKNSYDLKNVLVDFFGDDNDENSFLSEHSTNLYYDTDSFTDKFAKNSNIFISINVCSLMSKYQSLN